MTRASYPEDLTASTQALARDVPAQRPAVLDVLAPLPTDLPNAWATAVGVRAPALAADGRLAYIADGPTGPRLWVRAMAAPAGSGSVDGAGNIDGAGAVGGVGVGGADGDGVGYGVAVDTGPGHVRAAMWSPGGELLAVQVAPGGGELTEVRIVDPASGLGAGGRPGGAWRLAGGDGGAAAPARWTTDGQALLVTESDRTDPSGHTLAVLITLDGRRVVLAEGVALQILDAVAIADGHRLLLREGPRGVRRALIVDARLTTAAEDGTTYASWELPGGRATVLSGRFVAGGHRALLVTDLGGRERAALLDVAVDGPGPARVLAARPDADVERIALLDTPTGQVAAPRPELAGVELVDTALGGMGLGRMGRDGMGRGATARAEAELIGTGLGAAGLGRAVVAWNVAGRSELTGVDLSTGEVHPLPAPPRAVITALLGRPGGRELVLAVEDATVPAELWTCHLGADSEDADAGEARWGAVHRCLVSRAPRQPRALVEPAPRTLAAHDGLTLSGFWYRPPAPPGPMPTLIYLHGGPEAQERPTFNPLIHALNARGIAVFAANVRGSTGYGRSFEEADHLHHRFDGIEDVASCVRDLVAAGLADPQRIAVAGRSYGGYLTLAALVAHPELFRAGVDVCGMVDLETFYQHTEPWIAASAVTKYGDPRTDPALLRALSPLHRMSRLAAPLLVVHGENDTNVPVHEAEQTIAAAQAHGVPCRYLLFPDEGHEVVGLAGRLRFVRETVTWLAAQLLTDRQPEDAVA
ncbi:alpha/beta fold hydrolase [Frankia sp. AgPm24]|uniref:S9 family peptidase n=1 Tax=Frankia sp. AgPm24 TaxID=631128 RepID=UPI00200C5D1F|nr:alpha/beta fold hydrolase [Frankia sp. AgPm24]MCK9925496.1 alpha/beta fold hydrolase [Frankia sp. AgPm24]